ncbi:multicopper oxidase domain-containing protein [Kribbella flavida]|uniref:multicopper oxidase domain-containing protein n=1 Tax=Kribbella flavida TaxID=182640 RepID=UPI0011D18A96
MTKYRRSTAADRYVLHCHNAEHEDRAMMANFEVVQPLVGSDAADGAGGVGAVLDVVPPDDGDVVRHPDPVVQ